MFQLPRLMPLTRGLLIATGVSFLLHTVMQVWVQFPLGSFTSLTTGRLTAWTALQLVTHPLAWRIGPNSAPVLLMNLVFLWLSVGPIEERYGRAATAQLLLIGTLVSGVLASLAGLLAPPDEVLGVSVWILACWGAYGWSLRDAPISPFGVPMRGVFYVWFALVWVVLDFLTNPRVPTLVAELAAIGAGVGFVAWRRRRLPPARVSSVVAIDSARKGRDGKKKPEWLN